MSQKHKRAKVESALKDKWGLTVRTQIPVINDKDERKVLLVYSEAAKKDNTNKYRQAIANANHVETMSMTSFEKLVDGSSLMAL